MAGRERVAGGICHPNAIAAIEYDAIRAQRQRANDCAVVPIFIDILLWQPSAGQVPARDGTAMVEEDARDREGQNKEGEDEPHPLMKTLPKL